MKRLTALVAAGMIALMATQARAVDPDKPLKVPATVTIVAFDKLEAAALALHPGRKLGFLHLRSVSLSRRWGCNAHPAMGARQGPDFDLAGPPRSTFPPGQTPGRTPCSPRISQHASAASASTTVG